MAGDETNRGMELGVFLFWSYVLVVNVIQQTVPKCSGLKQQAFYYISQLHGIGIQAGLTWVILVIDRDCSKVFSWRMGLIC